jgi:hypothetical protein
MLCHLECMHLMTPGNSRAFMAVLITFVQFDIIPGEFLDWMNYYIIGVDETDPFSQNFDAAGYGSEMIVTNLGSLFSILILNLVVPLVVQILFELELFCYRPFRLWIVQKHREYIWNGVISLF